MAGTNLRNYYLYAGSLTTPMCGETVTWVVMTDILTLSQQQLAAFQNLKYLFVCFL